MATQKANNIYIFLITISNFRAKIVQFAQKSVTLHEKFGIMKKLLICICSVLVLCACKNESSENSIFDRTVLVYMAGENNLDEFIDSELEQMKQGSKDIGDRNRFIVYVDRADTKTKPYYARIHDGVIDTTFVTTTDTKTSDPAVMEEVINKVFKENPAHEYGLVLWGHASGWLIEADSIAYNSTTATSARRRAYGGDTGNNSKLSAGRTWMNIPSMANMLRTTGYHLKFIFADCCTFMCVENAYELRDVCDYLIGSPAEITGVGAPYNTVVPAMFSQSETFYKQIADKYYEQTVQSLKVPLTVVKSQEMQQLAAATRTLLHDIVPQVTTDGEGVSAKYIDMTGRVYYYDTGVCAMYDMKDFLQTYARQLGIEGDYNQWQAALDKAVVYRLYAAQWVTAYHTNFYDFTNTEDGTCGLSMYIPQSPFQGKYFNYNKYIKQMAWYYAAGYGDIGW